MKKAISQGAKIAGILGPYIWYGAKYLSTLQGTPAYALGIAVAWLLILVSWAALNLEDKYGTHIVSEVFSIVGLIVAYIDVFT